MFLLIFKEVITMKRNSSIGCTVSECSYHYKQDDYCTLDRIQVVRHGHEAVTVECTDCGSFRRS